MMIPVSSVKFDEIELPIDPIKIGFARWQWHHKNRYIEF